MVEDAYWGKVAITYSRRLRSFAIRKDVQPADADDIVQETLNKMLEKFGSSIFSDDELRRKLFGEERNVIQAYFRKRRRAVPEDLSRVPAELLAFSESPFEQVARLKRYAREHFSAEDYAVLEAIGAREPCIKAGLSRSTYYRKLPRVIDQCRRFFEGAANDA